MTDKQFALCVSEAQNYNDRDAYLSSLSLSPDRGEGSESFLPPDLVDRLGSIWDAAHRSVSDIRSAVHMTQSAFAQRFCMPLRTVENWCRGVNTPPPYVLLMMQECLGLIRR